MRTNRPLLLLALTLIAAFAVFWLIRGFRGEAGVPDTSSKVDEVTSDPDPRPLSVDGEGPLEAPSVDGVPSTPASASGFDADSLAAWRIAAHLTGTVVDDATDLPVADAEISVRRMHSSAVRGAPAPDGPTLAETTSDPDGTFALDVGPDQWLRLVVTARGYATTGIRVASTGASVEVRLARAAVLEVSLSGALEPPGGFLEVRVGDTIARKALDGSINEFLVPPGAAHVRAGSDEHGTVKAGPFALVSGVRTVVDLALPSGGIRLAGRVIDAATNAPLEGAKVRVVRPGRADDAGITDATGHFASDAAGSEGERVFVLVEPPAGYAPALEPVILRRVDPTGGLQTLEIALRPGEPWTGEVIAPPGVSAEGVAVYYTAAGIGLEETGATTTTDEDGRFELPPPPPPAPGRRVVLVAEKDGYTTSLALRPHQLRPAPLLLHLDGGVTVSGRLVDADGEPARGAQIRLWPDWGRSAGGANALSPAESRVRLSNERGFSDLATATGPEGRFVLRGVPATRFQLQVQWRGRDRWPGVTVDADRGAVDVGTVVLGSGLVLEGRVRDRSGAALVGAHVRLQVRDADFRRPLEATTDANGEYTFVDLAPGRFLVSAEHPGHARRSEDVDVEANTLIDLALDRSGALALEVVQDGAPYTGRARVRLRAARDGRTVGVPRSIRLRDGRASIEDVPPGTWNVEVATEAGAVGYANEIQVDFGIAIEARIELGAASTLAGRITTRDGDGVSSARLLLIHAEHGNHHSATAMMDGRFRIQGLAPGAWRLHVDGRGGVPQTFDVDVRAGEVTTFVAALARGGSVRVRVVDKGGNPQAGTLIVFRDAERAYPASPPDRTERDGTATRHDLPPGRIFIKVRVDGMEGRGVVTVVKGQTVDVTVKVVRAGS